jgi:hypothetical protein
MDNGNKEQRVASAEMRDFRASGSFKLELEVRAVEGLVGGGLRCKLNYPGFL